MAASSTPDALAARKIRVINWKMNMKRPTAEQAAAVLSHGGPCDVICVYEGEVSKRGAAESAATIAASHAPFAEEYAVLAEHREECTKYDIFMSILGRKDSAGCVALRGDFVRVCRSQHPGQDQKVCVSHDLSLSAPGCRDTGLSLLGINLDPRERPRLAQVTEIESWSETVATDCVVSFGDFNTRLRKPEWASLEEVDVGSPSRSGLSKASDDSPTASSGLPGRVDSELPGSPLGRGVKPMLQDSSVSLIVERLMTVEGRRELTRLDILENTAECVESVRILAAGWRFNPLDPEGGPPLPSYKRTSGVTPDGTAETLDRLFFQMPQKQRSPTSVFQQRLLASSEYSGHTLDLMQLGWLDRTGVRYTSRGKEKGVALEFVQHSVLDEPALSDHAAVVTDVSLALPRSG
eukprot:TRINITY_DN8176_c0_g1_i1.p1 TRINITY_DN8176_c0_g1~~TRINITY_DN8176_c0_g1_i1.p1  ORF type:complete len:408 (+),score=124.97 TRINITY_DN8176_c0_g1_i1:98-1321(+)